MTKPKINVTIEVWGQRGSGKTTILKLIQEVLNDRKNIAVTEILQNPDPDNSEYIHVVGSFD